MNKLNEILRSRYFWIVIIMLIVCAFFHYFVPQVPLLPQSRFPMTRQAVVRIIFLLPVAAAAFAFGLTGGVIALGASILVMLPRVVWISTNPPDALFETIGIVLVGFILVWMIEIQEREKRTRQRAVEELQTVNAVALTLTQPYDLDAMLAKTLARALEAVGSQEPKGAIFLFNPWRQMLVLRAHQGLPPEFVEREQEIPVDEGLLGLTAKSGDVLVVRNALDHPNHTHCPGLESHAHICIPLKSKDQFLGVMDFYLHESHSVDAIDREMFATIGRQVGVAVENARLCENLRFYFRQVNRVQEEERKRIARELHDDTAQGLIDLALGLDHLGLDEPLSNPVLERVEKLQQRIDEMLEGVRRFSRDLRPSVLDDLGLLPALEWLLSDLEKSGIQARLEIVGEQRRLETDVELELFRIVQEAINNVKRHAHASEVVTVVEFHETEIRLSIRDDGIGFDLPGATGDLVTMGKFGLVGMEERAHLLRGQFKVLSGQGTGTAVIVEVPS